ncbi:Malonyl CoA-acyl carrier protein transacylase [Desulfatibacillum aliphaticivorans]|uniref:Malonyl CoA-acyl carrier protein transacylase n=1 Tax=Desulfatibacillum aliphaticivorans TaxID=218208 RepID=B8FLI2_DESAL|nr:ACP S-malonyltransferase [Desulfatibacillum aliphaticivorans]ACL05128.1 Malonyl CoA-acyl carrier protein transacylase [Desulfatibacillum aliphaticivorans]
MNNTVFMFPGQGSQFVGMGQDFHDEFVFVRELFDMVEELCKRHIRRLCFNGPMEDLTETVNLQPAITAVNLACMEAIIREGVKPSLTAGHSLGEYSALQCSGAISAEDCFKLVFKRGELMHREACANKGTMAAVMGLEIKAVSAIVEQAQSAGVVSVANHNTQNQIVITGSPEGVKQACALAKEQKARAIPLKVSGAWHSALMQGAKEEFAAYLDEFTFSEPECPVVMNVTGEPCSGAAELKEIMAIQLTSPVKWCDSLLGMQESGTEVFVEIGPKNVLTGMVKKVLDDKEKPCVVHNVQDLKSLEAFLKAVV